MAAARGQAAATSGRCCTADGRPGRAVRGVVRPARSRSGCRSPEGARTRHGSAAGCRRAHRRRRRRRGRSRPRSRPSRRRPRWSSSSTHQLAIASLSCTTSRPQSRAAGGGAARRGCAAARPRLAVLVADEHLDLLGESQEAAVEVAGDPLPAGVGDTFGGLDGVVALVPAEQHDLGAVVLAAQ